LSKEFRFTRKVTFPSSSKFSESAKSAKSADAIAVSRIKAPRGAKSELLRQTIENLTGDFIVTELERLCPGSSRDHLRRLLKEMKANGLIACLGRGPGAKWRKAGHDRKRGS
jgi:hypothetical protein